VPAVAGEDVFCRQASVVVSVVSMGIVDIPTGDVEDSAFAGHVVLNADVEVLSRGVEDATRPFRRDVVQRSDPNAAVAHQIVVLAVRQAVPEIVVVRVWNVVSASSCRTQLPR
jgi:hypothetical protein